MRSIGFLTGLTASILFSFIGSVSAGEQTVACPLLTQAQVSAATGTPMDAGSPIARPGTCQWGGKGKIVTLTINQTRAGKSPVDQFNDGKTQKLPGVTIESVGGVADDAYYVFYTGTNRAGCGIVVKKGSGAFEIRVYGFDLSQAKVAAKTLAQDAVNKF